MMQCSDKLGLSLELGSFAAGIMISTTDLAQHTLEQVIYYIFLAFCFAYPSFFFKLKSGATSKFDLSFTACAKFIARLL